MIELGADVEARQWAIDSRAAAGVVPSAFPAWATAISNNFRFVQPDSFADAVWKRIISASRLRPLYLIGPYVGLLP